MYIIPKYMIPSRMDMTAEMHTEFVALRCACGSADLVAIEPGVEPLRVAIDLFNAPLDTGQRTVARYMSCLLKQYPMLNKGGAE